MDLFIGIAFPSILILLSGHIIWKSTDGFECAADYLGRKMSRGVKGASINAIASSMPEFLTTMFFLFYIKDKDVFVDSFSGGLGVVAGSAVFNILIIPLAIILFGGILATGAFKLDKKVVRRDGSFLIFSNVVLIYIVAQNTITSFHGVILTGIYLIYLLLLRKGMGLTNEQHVDLHAYEIEKVKLGFKHFIFLDIKQVLLNGKKLNRTNTIFTLLFSTAVMSIGTWMLVEGTKLLGEAQYGEGSTLANLFGLEAFKGLNMPLVFLSVVLAAAATSIPDTMISVRDARKGNHDDSISNAIGSNIFDISFAIGFPIFLYTLINGPISLSAPVQKWTMGILLAMWIINILVVILFMPKRIPMKLRGTVLLMLYLAFLAFLLLEHASSDIRFVQWILGIFS